MSQPTATSSGTAPVELDVAGICAALDGKIRGSAVAVTMFRDEIHPAYALSPRVDACGILRIARDEQRAVHMDSSRHDCSHGEFLLGFSEGDELMTTGKLLPVFIPAYTLEAGLAVNSGEFRLPRDAVRGIGAAPLEAVPDGAPVEWIVVVAEPVWAGQIAAARSVVDGTPPGSAAGSSFCTDAFVTPWYDDNVIITTGDFGGRMANKLRPSEMFVIVPARWANNLVSILAEAPDVKGLYEATRTAESDYWSRKKAREEKAAARASAPSTSDAAARAGLKVSMEWDDEAVAMVAKAPGFVRKFAVGNLEDYAEQNGYDRVTAAVVREQMEAAGVGGMTGATRNAGGMLRSLFRRAPKP
jgi:uncharacterized protein (DUF169 family)